MHHAYPSVLLTISFFLFFYLLTVGVGYCCAWSRSMTQSTVELLRTSIVPHAKISTWQHTTLTTDRPPCPQHVSNSQSNNRVAADSRHALDYAAIRIDYVHHAYRISSGWLITVTIGKGKIKLFPSMISTMRLTKKQRQSSMHSQRHKSVLF